MPVPAYDPTTDIGKVRLLLSDVAEPFVFVDREVQAFLDLEDGSVKRAAAQAIDTNATDQVLASKVLRTQNLTTDGAKVADAMRKHAAALREQADDADGGFFDVVDLNGCGRPELTEYRSPWGCTF